MLQYNYNITQLNSLERVGSVELLYVPYIHYLYQILRKKH